jgi:hypothetical protein
MSLIGRSSRIGGGAVMAIVVLCYTFFGPRLLVVD